MSQKSFTILADGCFPTHETPLAHLRNAQCVVCCDGAAVKLTEFGREPDYIVGDLDSLPETFKEKYADRLYPSADQETNDQTKAVLFCKEQGATAITIIGATGLREDHTLGNISLLTDYAETFPDIEMMTDYGVFTVMTRSGSLPSHKGQQISIFALDSRARLTVGNLKYPIPGKPLSSWWQGTLNEALGESFSLNFEEGRWIVFRCY
ncbi:thiamine diphosphokinase [Paludibacter jiangxiensis]|uniref:Thiamine diphosphokinase n=1 Tax=Paludibacter jiangxiensis TaxID=681398 RepID=A0A161LF14_9BACT|nr:thiamine diphosphokinase [Paludibacter jiangxiensis]GAT63057.1 thiamine pyrophosphokinase [Paludibacter jiangxiensis]